MKFNGSNIKFSFIIFTTLLKIVSSNASPKLNPKILFKSKDNKKGKRHKEGRDQVQALVGINLCTYEIKKGKRHLTLPRMHVIATRRKAYSRDH